MKKIFVAEPKLEGNERKYVIDCIDSNWISSNGKYIDAFENAFAEFCDTRYAVSTNNGTTALHLAMLALDLQPGDEVIVPVITYIATANAVSYCGAKPIFVDVYENSLNINVALIEQKITPKTKGIIAVHLYGQPADMISICEIAHRYGLWVVEDAAEAHGAELNGKKVGSFGDCATFSFYGNKIITTGEGGMITTNNSLLAERIRLYKGQGMDPARRYWFPVVGYNYRMTNIQAAIGLAQLETVQSAILHRGKLGRWYRDYLNKYSDKITLPDFEEDAGAVIWMYNIFIKGVDQAKRDLIMGELNSMGIETRPTFYPLHFLPPYRSDEVFQTAEDWSQRGINLPTHQFIELEQVQYIAESLGRVLDK